MAHSMYEIASPMEYNPSIKHDLRVCVINQIKHEITSQIPKAAYSGFDGYVFYGE